MEFNLYYQSYLRKYIGRVRKGNRKKRIIVKLVNKFYSECSKSYLLIIILNISGLNILIKRFGVIGWIKK